MVALLVGHRTCDSRVAGSSPGWAPQHSGYGQATYNCVPLSLSSIIPYQPMGRWSLAGKVSAGLMEGNGSIPPSSWLSHMQVTVMKPGSATCPTLVIEYRITLLFWVSKVELSNERIKEVIAIKKLTPVKFLTHDKILYTSATLPCNRNIPKIAKIRLYSFSELLFTV